MSHTAASRTTRTAERLSRLSLLGGFGLRHAGRPVAASPSAQRLLALLAVKQRAVSRTAAAETLWPDALPDRGAASLRSALWRLPAPEGVSLVEPCASGIRLSPHVEVDVRTVEQRAASLDDAGDAQPSTDVDVEVLCLDLLPDWPEEWLLVAREWFRQLRLHALEALCVRHRRAGRYEAALRAGMAAVFCEPLRESAHRRVVEVHLSEGNDAEALREYHLYRRMLRDELGLAPSPKIRQLVAPLLGRPADGG
jgi:DNA-binding SARP family transcriptional activator